MTRDQINPFDDFANLSGPLPMTMHLDAINRHAMWLGAPWGCYWRFS